MGGNLEQRDGERGPEATDPVKQRAERALHQLDQALGGPGDRVISSMTGQPHASWQDARRFVRAILADDPSQQQVYDSGEYIDATTVFDFSESGRLTRIPNGNLGR